MDCTRASDMIMGYFDKSLRDDEKSELLQHLKVCGLCSEEFKALQEVISTVGELEDFMAPDNFEAEIMCNIDLKLYAEPNRKHAKTPWVIGVLLAVSLLCVSIYLRYGSVDINEMYRNFTSVTQWLNVTTMVNRLIRMVAAVVMVWLQILEDLPFYLKGMIGAYVAILSFLCSFFIGIHLILMKLTTGQIIEGGSVYEK